jgi:hypothetical protein
LCQTPNLEDRVPLCMSPIDRVAQLYPQAHGSLFVAFYDSRGYGGGILTLLHTRASKNRTKHTITLSGQTEVCFLPASYWLPCVFCDTEDGVRNVGNHPLDCTAYVPEYFKHSSYLPINRPSLCLN